MGNINSALKYKKIQFRIGGKMNLIQKIRIFIIKHYKGLLKAVFSSALIALIIYEGGKQIQSIRLADTLHTMRAIPVQWLFLFFLQ